MNYNTDRLIKLRELIYQTLDPLIDSDYCLLDIPDHTNIGDHLIYKGELAYLKRLPFKMKYVSNNRFYDLRKIPADSIILLHGGGNFGDLWRTFQKFRMRVIQDFPNNKIIIFPQTVFYKDSKTIIEDAEIFNKHSNLIICARDTVSYDLLSKHFINNKILLLPDMAFCLDLDQYITDKKTNRILIFKRTDKEINKNNNPEQIASLITSNYKTDIRDWPSQQTKEVKFILLHILNYINRKMSNVFMKYSFFRPYVDHRYGMVRGDLSEWYMLEGIKFINKYDEIFTTRLHGYILSILLNKKVHMIDNSYGKNSNFYNCWMTEFEHSEFLKV